MSAGGPAGALTRALERDAAFTAVALGRQLRAAGLRVTPDRSATFAAACALLPRDRDAHYWAARLAFVAGREDLPIFDAVFAAVVDGLTDPAGADRGDAAAAPPPSRTRSDAERHATPQETGNESPPEPPGAAEGGADADRPGRDESRRLPVGSAAADTERLAGVRLDQLDEHELALVARYVRRLAIATPPRRARRASASRRGEHLDVRSTVRRSLRTGGDPVVRLHRRRHRRPRPLVALLDVSGSMAPYARAYLLLLEGAARGAGAEVFVFATRLTRVTRALRDGRAPEALARASAAAPDWAGGTRLGEALRAFNDRHGRRGMARGAVVVVLSDGWEGGDPALVGREMRRLRLLAYRVVWVNPRVAAPGFAPRTGGMAAALPYVDELVSGHTLSALDEVVAAVGRPC